MMRIRATQVVRFVSLLIVFSFIGGSVMVRPLQAQGNDHQLFLPMMAASGPVTTQPLNDLLVEGADGDIFLNPDGSYCLSQAAIHPVAESIATRYNVQYATLISWLCGQGAAFGQTLLALQTANHTPVDGAAIDRPPHDKFVEELLDRKHKKESWGKIWQEEGLIGKPEHAGSPNGKGKPGHAGPPDGLELPEKEANEEPEEEEEIDEPEEESEEPEEEEESKETNSPKAKMNPFCDAIEGTMKLPPHPVAQGIAATYAEDGVTYEQVIMWFCDGFGFGQILLALETAKVTGESAQDLLDRRAAGEGWGRIWQDLNLIGRPN